MKSTGAIRYKLKQVKFRHRKRVAAAAAAAKRSPENCIYHHHLGVGVDICLFGAHDPKTWENHICSEECLSFEPKTTVEHAVEHAKEMFQRDMEADIPTIALNYPDVAALLWVLDREEEDEVMPSALLDVFPFTSRDIKRGVIPLAMEFPVEAKLAPYLVSSSKATVWVHKASKLSYVRAAVRDLGEAGIGQFFHEVVEQVKKMGLEVQWGNVHAFDLVGITAAIQHVASQGFEEIDVLVHPETKNNADVAAIPFGGMLANTQVVEADWMQPNSIVVVPRNREYLGFAGMVSNRTLISVVHNASRGMGIAV